jgi:hypothetical protein
MCCTSRVEVVVSGDKRQQDEGTARILFVENHVVFARTVVDEFLVGFDVTIAPGLAEVRRCLGPGASRWC